MRQATATLVAPWRSSMRMGALNSANERAIQTELQGVAKNKTTLVIAHRLSIMADAHVILVMDAGRI